MKKTIFTLILLVGTLLGALDPVQATCVHDPEAENNGNCEADAYKDENGKLVVAGYFCRTYTPAPGYPSVYNCVIGEGGVPSGNNDNIDQIQIGL